MFRDGEIIENKNLTGSCWKVVFYAPVTALAAEPGQFIHVRIEQNKDRILRRPFSIFDTDPDAGTVSIVYKVVGSGTEILSTLCPGECCDVMGPLGIPFKVPTEEDIPVMVAGGYGAAATYLLAKKSHHKGILLLGARTAADLSLVEDYRALGTEIRIITEDGSVGEKGLVTALLAPILDEGNPRYRVSACGPHGMLIAIGKQCLAAGIPDAELSLDQPMCCGVGACFACVVQVCDPGSADGWRYARSCSEGPVFPASAIWYGKGE